jgi:hypothetical protein
MDQKDSADSSAPIGCSAVDGPQLPLNAARSADAILAELSDALYVKYREACDQQDPTRGLKSQWVLFGRIKALEEFTVLVTALRECEKRRAAKGLG